MLESIRDLMNEDTVMPDWLHDIFLGYGDPAQAKYTNMPADQLLQTIDFKVQSWLCSSVASASAGLDCEAGDSAVAARSSAGPSGRP